jgi:gas vesicle protein
MSQELNARTTILATDLFNHIDKTDKDIEAIRLQVTQGKEQISTEVTNEIKTASDRVSSQILAERQKSQAEILKVNQEIDKLKNTLSTRTIGDSPAVSLSTHNCNVRRLDTNSEVNGPTETGSDAGKNNNNDQASVNGIHACQNTGSCSESVNYVMSEVHGCHNNVNANSTMLANCSSLNELTLPT